MSKYKGNKHSNNQEIYQTMFILFLLHGCTKTQSPTHVDPPNVLMICVDDMNDCVGYLNGYPDVQTPNIDHLALQGINFTNAHCPSPKCAPSRTAIITGLRPSTSGIYDNEQWWPPNLPDVLTMPVFFRQNGYLVLGAGKIYHHTVVNNPPDQWDEYHRLVFHDNWGRTKPDHNTAPWADYERMPEYVPLNDITPYRHEYDWGSLDKPIDKYGDMYTVRWAREQLQKDHEKPFFTAVGIFRPHMPFYVPDASFIDKYPIETLALPEINEHDFDDLEQSSIDFIKGYGKYGWMSTFEHEKQRDPDIYKKAVRHYQAACSYADYNIGRLLNTMNENGLTKNTIVVLWSDHGYHLGEKEHWEKFVLTEKSTHIPYIIVVPGEWQGRRITYPVSLVDLYPTLAELCGLPILAHVEEQSLVPILKDSVNRLDQPVIITYGKKNHAILGDEFRYIRLADGTEELYKTTTDKHEWYNLARDPEYRIIMDSLATWIPAINAELVSPAKTLR